MSAAHDVLQGNGYNRLVKARYGYVLYNSNDIVVGRSIEYYGEYFESEVDVFRSIVRPNDAVIDVGSNIGTHALALARIVGPNGCVLAVEPQRLVFQILCANAAINSLENIECLHGGLSDKTGTMDIGDVSLSRPNNFGGIPLGAVVGNMRTPVYRLDDYYRRDRLRLIKVDVEGMEFAVIRGAEKTIAKFRPALYVENDRVEKSEELLRLLEHLSYNCYWHFPVFHNHNNFFGATERIHQQRFIDKGDRFECIGFAVNLFCFPKNSAVTVNSMHPVLNVEEHPFKKECNPRFMSPPS